MQPARCADHPRRWRKHAERHHALRFTAAYRPRTTTWRPSMSSTRPRERWRISASTPASPARLAASPRRCRRSSATIAEAVCPLSGGGLYRHPTRRRVPTKYPARWIVVATAQPDRIPRLLSVAGFAYPARLLLTPAFALQRCSGRVAALEGAGAIWVNAHCCRASWNRDSRYAVCPQARSTFQDHNSEKVFTVLVSAAQFLRCCSRSILPVRSLLVRLVICR